MIGRASFLAYYLSAFALEPAFFNALFGKDTARAWRALRSRVCTRSFLPALAVVAGSCLWFDYAGTQIRWTCSMVPKCSRMRNLSPWFPRRTIDLSDDQWASYRSALPALVCAAAALVLAGKALDATGGRRRFRLAFNAVVGVALATYVHGAGVVFPLAFCAFFHVSATNVATSWSCGLLMLAAAEPKLPLLRHLTFRGLLGAQFKALDRFGGVYPWHRTANLVVLRLLSYALDRCRTAPASANADYSLVNCVSHAFYAPLFVSGPTMRFDAYISAVRGPRAATQDDAAGAVDRPPPAASAGAIAAYAAGVLAMLATLEHWLHRYQLFAVARSGSLARLPPHLGAAAVFLLLNAMWLKFCIIWRVARLWALCDGVAPPENMLRALCNARSVTEFWRGWHSSFNEWLVAYIYVPLGGRRNRALATTAAFAFTVVWHDLEPRLLMWGGGNAVFLFAENAAAAAWRRRHGGADDARGGMRAVASILALVAVNTVGYGAGERGLRGVARAVAEAPLGASLAGIAATVGLLWSAVRVMDEARAVETGGVLKKSA